MDKYEEMFGDIFPLMELPIMTEEEVENAIIRCLSEEKPAQEVFNIVYEQRQY